MTPNSLGALGIHLEAADRHIGAGFDVIGDHGAVIHLVDVIAGKHQDVVRIVIANDVEVLEYRVGCSRIPGGLRDALLGRPQFHELAEFAAQESPAFLDMQDQ